MSVLSITKPLPMVLGGTFPGVTRLATADPKEAAINTSSGARTIDIDLGAVVSVDTLYLGYTDGDAPGDLTVTSGASGYTTDARGTIEAAPTDIPEDPRHWLRTFAAPFSARYIRVSGTFPADYGIGALAVGKAFRPTWGHEFGAGRPLTDTSAVERLFGGGFGIDPGVVASGWEWTLGDLQPNDLRALYALIKNRGTARTVLVAEDPDVTDGLNERLHWGLFTRLAKYERLTALDSSWGLAISDWA